MREIFQRVADGEFISQITKNFQSCRKIGSSWTYSRVYTMLKKENYKGVLVQHMSEKALYKNSMLSTSSTNNISIQDISK